MTFENVIAFIIISLLSGLRSIFLKKQAKCEFGSKQFWWILSFCFFAGSIPLSFFIKTIPLNAIILVIVGAVLLVVSFSCFSKGLQDGDINICSLLFSMGFLFPTISGLIFWNESFTKFKLLGMILAIVAIVVSGLKNKTNPTVKGKKKGFFIPCLCSMLATGGFGIVLTVFRKKCETNELAAFLFATWFLVAVICFFVGCISKKKDTPPQKSTIIFSALAGICYGLSVYLQSLLIGAVDVTIVFPVANIGVLISTVLLSLIFCKQKLTVRSSIVVVIGMLAILVLNL